MFEITSRFFNNKCISSIMLQDFINLNRQWHLTHHGRMFKNLHERLEEGSFEFSLMSYNILSQDLIQDHRDLYSNCLPGSLEWPQRGERICRELREVNPDIICLQEVNCYHHAQFYKPFLTNQGYAGLYKKRTGDKWDGCALYYKADKFTLLDHIEVEFYRKDVTFLLNRDNVAIIGVLKPRVSNDRVSNSLVVATTHLLFNPKRGDIKLAQIRLLLAEVDKIASQQVANQSGEPKHCDIILCGDYNSEPYSPLYRFMTEGQLETSGYRSGDISGQPEGYGQGYPFRSCDLNLKGIDRSTLYHNHVSSREVDKASVGGSGRQLEEDIISKSDHEYSNHDDYSQNNSSRVSHQFKFYSVYPPRDVNNKPFVTTHHLKASCMVDYIFYNRSESLKLLGYQRLLNCDQMRLIGTLPNNYIGSDHLSLHAKFHLRLDFKPNST